MLHYHHGLSLTIVSEILYLLKRCTSNMFYALPVFEESSEAKSHEFEKGLQDEEDSEDIIAVLQCLI